MYYNDFAFEIAFYESKKENKFNNKTISSIPVFIRFNFGICK